MGYLDKSDRMTLIDTHCHMYLPDFEADISEVVQRARESGVEKCYLPAVDSHTMDQLLGLESRFPGFFVAMAGLHPCSVQENYLQELELVKSLLARRTFAAVGEIGLDYYWDRSFDTQQMEAFETQIGWAMQYDLPIVIHSRNSIDECIEVVARHQSGSLKGIFHCFSGSLEQARKIIGLGFYLGIGGVLTYKKSTLPDVLQHISMDHLVLETDAPYLPPVPFRGKRNESSFLTFILEKLAHIKGVSAGEAAGMTTSNAKKIFGT